jgi:hypothetical protein
MGRFVSLVPCSRPRTGDEIRRSHTDLLDARRDDDPRASFDRQIRMRTDGDGLDLRKRADPGAVRIDPIVVRMEILCQTGSVPVGVIGHEKLMVLIAMEGVIAATRGTQGAGITKNSDL